MCVMDNIYNTYNTLHIHTGKYVKIPLYGFPRRISKI